MMNNHPESTEGARTAVDAIFRSRDGYCKNEIKEFIKENFLYDLDRTLEEIKSFYSFNETSQKTLPETIICFLESENFEDALRKAIWLGGDKDTLALRA
jgi:ADP-ribosyl-[dinitrogen reductase] hydrolase